MASACVCVRVGVLMISSTVLYEAGWISPAVWWAVLSVALYSTCVYYVWVVAPFVASAPLNSTEKRLDLNSVVYTTCISLIINRRARSRYTCMGAALYDRLVPAPANI